MAIRAEAVSIEETGKKGSLDRRYKRPFDICTVVAAHLLLAPVWVVVWIAIPIAIKLDDRGPVFYYQRRIGRNGKIFTVRKFRSMVFNAEKNTGAVWASRNDPRTTRIGRFLRHTALDELPQVINVLRGDMSLVGPRPERPELHEQINEETPGFDERLRVRPGMAGLAQVYGEYDLAPASKLAYDMQYIQSANILLDLKLLTLATLNSFLGRWGYAKGMRPRVQKDRADDGKIVQFTTSIEHSTHRSSGHASTRNSSAGETDEQSSRAA